jgi:transcription elongation GreA/GreB family factor
MSRLFVTEPGEGDAVVDPADRPVSPHPNFVTPDGMAQIELALARCQEDWALAHAAGDMAETARIDREMRYWVSRRGTAQVVAAPPDEDRVHFGSTATVEDTDGRRRTLRIVGEDEAEAAEEGLSYVTPLAQALMGRKVGDRVTADGEGVEIVSIGQVGRA